MKVGITVEIPNKFTCTPDFKPYKIHYVYEAIGEDMPHAFLVTEYYGRRALRSWFITRQEYIETYRNHILGLEP